MRNREIGLERNEATVAFDERSQSGVLHGEFTKLVLTRNHARVRQKATDFLESLVQFFELAPDGVFHGREL